MVCKHAYLNILLLLHSAYMLCVVKMSLKGEVGGSALKSHGNYVIDHGKSWKNHGIVILNFCGNPEFYVILLFSGSTGESAGHQCCLHSVLSTGRSELSFSYA